MLVLFAINETPNSPFGDSTALYVQPVGTLKPSLQYLK
jgi:hypothetical protein